MFWKRRQGPADVMTGPLVRCSFCNKSQREVAKMVAGPHVSICSECVEICRVLLSNDDTVIEPQTPEQFEVSERLISGNNAIRCALCSAVRPLSESVQISGRGWLCRSCARAAQDTVRGKADPAA